MSRIVNRRPQAIVDLIEQAIYLAEQSSRAELADQFLTTAEEAFQQLCQWPKQGSLREYLNPKLAGLRMWPMPGFPRMLIFYLETDDEIEVVRVVHASRDLGSIFSE